MARGNAHSLPTANSCIRTKYVEVTAELYQDRVFGSSPGRIKQAMESLGNTTYLSPNQQIIAEGNFQFSTDLDVLLLSGGTTPNLVLSPFGLGLVLMMARLGARGNTAMEMDSAFHFPSDEKALLTGYDESLDFIRKFSSQYNITVENKLFVNNHIELSRPYLKKLKKLDTKVERRNFKDASGSARSINAWVNEVTHGRTSQLVSESELSEETSLILANVIYFKGTWQDRFEQVKPLPFHLGENKTKEVDMMFISSKFKHAEFPEIDTKVVSMPYKGDRFAMLLYVPNTITGLGSTLEGLKKLSLHNLLARLTVGEDVNLHMPRFKLESTLQLTEPLQKLGAKSMFSQEADFSRMTAHSHRKSQVRVSSVVQKAFIEVTEEGTEAGAATGLKAVLLSFRKEFNVKADRPFYFQILDLITNMVIFSGVVRDP